MHFSYSCSCGWESLVLNEAQAHANHMLHTVCVHGTISAQENVGIIRELAKSVEAKARELEVIRQAKNRGLL